MNVDIHNREVVHIALCVNDSWAEHVTPLVYSLSISNSKDNFEIHLVYRDISEEKLADIKQLESLLSNISLDFCRIEEGAIDRIPVEGYYLPLETYFRLLLPDLLPEVPKIIYLDIDMMVLDTIRPLWETELGNSCIGACYELDAWVRCPDNLESMGFKQGEFYFNAGMLLLDLEKMRQRNLSDELIHEAIEKVSRLRYGDQDLLNLYFKNEVVPISEQFNYTNALMYERGLPEQVAIVHFNGFSKPWNNMVDIPGPVRPFAARYQAVLRAYHQLANQQKNIVSLVVLASGACSHLSQCLSSILTQTYTNLDVIVLMKDLSHSTRKEVEELQSYDHRLRLVEVDNLSFVQLARLTARGDYVSLVLSDDFLEESFVADLLEIAEQEQADVVVSDYHTLDVERGLFLFKTELDGMSEIVSSREAIARQWNPLFEGLWGKLIHRDLLDSIPQMAAAEMTQTRQLYSLSKKIVYCQTSYFCHRTQMPKAYPENLLGYYQEKIAELESLLADYHLLGLDAAWVVERLRELFFTAQQELAEQYPHFSRYLQTKLQLTQH